VPDDRTPGGDTCLLIVSGSNMAGMFDDRMRSGVVGIEV